MGDNHSLSEKVFHKLQEDILSGKYAVDEELKEKTIGDELGVSRTPVREALRQLELQGLVTITPNKGAHVTGFSKEDLNDIYEIRSVMEGLCAKWAAKKATPEQIEELEEIVYLTEFHVSKGHSGQVFELDNKFHETLYQASGSKVLAGFAASVMLLCNVFCELSELVSVLLSRLPLCREAFPELKLPLVREDAPVPVLLPVLPLSEEAASLEELPSELLCAAVLSEAAVTMVAFISVLFPDL